MIAIRYDPLSIRRDRLGKELYNYKNKENKIIIVSCDDETQGVSFCQSLTEKYFENVFLLSVSVNRFCSKYPHLSGGTKIPQAPNPYSPKKLKYRTRSKSNSKLKPKTNTKLNQANLNKNHSSNLKNVDIDCQSNCSKRSTMSRMSRMSTVSTRTWMP